MAKSWNVTEGERWSGNERAAVIRMRIQNGGQQHRNKGKYTTKTGIKASF